MSWLFEGNEEVNQELKELVKTRDTYLETATHLNAILLARPGFKVSQNIAGALNELGGVRREVEAGWTHAFLTSCLSC